MFPIRTKIDINLKDQLSNSRSNKTSSELAEEKLPLTESQYSTNHAKPSPTCTPCTKSQQILPHFLPVDFYINFKSLADAKMLQNENRTHITSFKVQNLNLDNWTLITDNLLSLIHWYLVPDVLPPQLCCWAPTNSLGEKRPSML